LYFLPVFADRVTSTDVSDPSTYYLRYYWWEIIVYNINITGPTNLGPYMRYYWMGPSSIKYAILVGGPSIYNVGYYWLGPPDVIYNITGWGQHI
jgi:hypothetical protein